MARFLKAVQADMSFIKSHTLQPKWYKVFKVFILAGFLAGYNSLFGFTKTMIFFGAFMCLMLLVHLVYRFKTEQFQKSWLDFIVVKTDEGGRQAQSIGWFYYAAIILNALGAVIVSQWF